MAAQLKMRRNKKLCTLKNSNGDPHTYHMNILFCEKTIFAAHLAIAIIIQKKLNSIRCACKHICVAETAESCLWVTVTHVSYTLFFFLLSYLNCHWVLYHTVKEIYSLLRVRRGQKTSWNSTPKYKMKNWKSEKIKKRRIEYKNVQKIKVVLWKQSANLNNSNNGNKMK